MLAFFFSTLCLSAFKVSDITVRMPFRLPAHQPPKYVLTAFDSNVKWECSDPTKVRIIENPRDHTRRSSITIEILHQGPHNEAVTITAKSKEETVAIPVYIDKIKSVEITTKSRTIFRGYQVTPYGITCFDEAGNTFSTIDSYNVTWNYDAKQIRSVPLNETDLFTKYKDGLPASEILIQGLEVGRKSLTATVNNEITSNVIEIDVVEPIHLVPPTKFMLPGAHFNVKLCTRNAFYQKNPDSDSTCETKLKIPDKKYTFYSVNETVATVEQNGRITAHVLGRTDIKVNDEVMPLNRVQMSVEVINPISIYIPDQYILVGQKPSFDQAVFKDYFGSPILEKPDHIDWEYNKDYEKVGTHTITAEAFNTKTQFIVHTCEPLAFNPSEVTLPVRHNGYKPHLTGGSGYITFHGSNETVFSYSEIFGTIKAGEEGVATLTVHDEKLNIEATLFVNVEEMVNPYFTFPDREFASGENITYSFKTTTRSGRPFTYLEEYTVTSNDQAVVRDNHNELVAVEQGFANITCTITGYSQTVLIGVFQHVEIQTIVTVNTNEPYDLSKQYGPLQWPESDKPVSSVQCGSARATIINDSILILRDKYKGQCTFTVQNPKSRLNPNPRIDSKEFQIQAEKIVNLAIAIEDHQSLNNPESGLIPSRVNETEALKLTTVRVPSVHRVFYNVYAFSFDEKLESLGLYQHPQMKILDQNNESFVNGSYITEPTTLTLYPPPTVEMEPKSIYIIPIHNISTTNFVSIYLYADHGTDIPITNGTGHYVTSGTDVTLNDNILTVYPAQTISDMTRYVIVQDEYIPEYQAKIMVLTEEPAKLEIDGEDYTIIGSIVEFTVHVYSQKGNEIQADSLNFTTETDGLNQTAPNKWKYHAKYVEQVNIIISTQGATGTRKLNVLDQIKYSPDHLVLFEGETVVPTLIGGGANEVLEHEYSNISVANIVDGLLRAVKPGTTVITTTAPNMPRLGKATLVVRVLEIRSIKVLRFPDQPYVDSYIHLTPVLETDDGDQPPRSASWTIRGSNTWEKLYDNSLMIRADRPGKVYAEVSAHNRNHTVIIDVDPRLQFRSPSKLSIPIGGNYTLQLVQPIENVEYTITTLSGPQSGLVVDSNGFIQTAAVGEYVVVARFKSQVVGTLVKVSIPAAVFLQSEGTSSVRPILLDIDGQEYSSHNGVLFTFNITNQYVSESGKYAFIIDSPTYLSVVANNTYFSVYNVTLLSDTLISPQSPIVIKGVETEFICAAKRPLWMSANPFAVSITQEGVAKAERRGRATIFCTDDISTPLTVTEIQALEIQERQEMHEYSINPIFAGGKFDPRQVVYPKDLQVTCRWNAPDCGRVYASSSSTLNDTSCIIELYKARRCPSLITLEAIASSRIANMSYLSTLYQIHYDSDIWGVPSEINATVSKRDPKVVVPLLPKENEVRIISGVVGLRTAFTPKGFEITADFNSFKGRGTIKLEYTGNKDSPDESLRKYIGEQIQINVFESNRSGIDYGDGKKPFLDRLLFNISIILTCIFGFYAAYMLGQSGNLPPLSPYKGRVQSPPK